MLALCEIRFWFNERPNRLWSTAAAAGISPDRSRNRKIIPVSDEDISCGFQIGTQRPERRRRRRVGRAKDALVVRAHTHTHKY